MSELLSALALIAVLAAVGSVCHDLLSYSRRQDEWERAHPGATYIPHYKRLAARGLLTGVE